MEIRLTKGFVSELVHPYLNTVQRLAQCQLQKIFRDDNNAQGFLSEWRSSTTVLLPSDGEKFQNKRSSGIQAK